MSPTTMENHHLQMGKSSVSMGHLATELCCFQGLHLDHGLVESIVGPFLVPGKKTQWYLQIPLGIKTNGLTTKSSGNWHGDISSVSPWYSCFMFYFLAVSPYHRITSHHHHHHHHHHLQCFPWPLAQHIMTTFYWTMDMWGQMYILSL